MLPFVDARIKRLATEAFCDNAKRAAMTDKEREIAAQFYEAVSALVVGTKAALATRYNKERARFMRGEVDHLAGSAKAFAREIGFEDEV